MVFGSSRRSFILSALTACLVACTTQTVDPGSSSSTGVGGTAGAGGMMPASGVTIELVHGAQTVTVDLGTFPTQTVKAAAVIPLGDLWTRAGLVADLSKVTFDFEGTDGFHPSAKPACMKNVTDIQLALGYVTPDTRTLVWDDSLGFPGCYFVKATAKIIAVDVP